MKHIFSSLILSYLATLARLALKCNRPPYIIGIAGSVGKSSTRNAVEALLKDLAPTVAIGNSETGIPLGILGIKPSGYTASDWLKMLLRAPFGLFYLKNVTFLIVEMGVDEPYPPKNMSYLLTIIQPTYGLLIQESAAHTEQFEKMLSTKQKESMSAKERLRYLIEAITHEDFKMVSTPTCETVIYNNDNEFIEKAVLESKQNKSHVSFGKEKTNTIWYDKYQLSENGTSMTFHTESDVINLEFTYFLPQEYQEVMAAAIALFYSFPLESFGNREDRKTYIEEHLPKNYTLPKGRAGNLKGIKNSIIIDSSYNASKVAVLAFLDMVAVLKKQTQRPVVFLFGDMRELGEERKIEHEEVAKRIPAMCDYVYCVGPLTKDYVIPHLEGKNIREVKWFSSNTEAGEYLKEYLPEKAIVLVKGSQNTIFLEETIKYLLEDHRDRNYLCRQEAYWLKIKRNQKRLAAM